MWLNEQVDQNPLERDIGTQLQRTVAPDVSISVVSKNKSKSNTSQVTSHTSRSSRTSRSSVSSTASSARIKAEAKKAALMARAASLAKKHALE